MPVVGKGLNITAVVLHAFISLKDSLLFVFGEKFIKVQGLSKKRSLGTFWPKNSIKRAKNGL